MAAFGDMDGNAAELDVDRRPHRLNDLVAQLERAADAATDRERLFAFRQATTLAADLLAHRNGVELTIAPPPPWTVSLPPSPIGLGEFLARLEELLVGAGTSEATTQALVIEANQALDNPPDAPLNQADAELRLARAERWLAAEAQALAGGPVHRPETALEELRHRLWAVVKIVGGNLLVDMAHKTSPSVQIGVGDTLVSALDIAREAGRRLIARGLLESSGGGQQPGRF